MEKKKKNNKIKVEDSKKKKSVNKKTPNKKTVKPVSTKKKNITPPKIESKKVVKTKKHVKSKNTKKYNKFIIKLKKSFTNIFKKKKKTKKILKKDNSKKRNDFKTKISEFKKKALNVLNRKIEVKKDGKLTKDFILFIFIIIELIVFNALLFISKIIPFEYYNSIEFLVLVFFIPFILIAFGLIYGSKFEFSWFIPSILALCFLPSVFSFLKISFVFYLPIYFIFVLSSEICGISIRKVRKDL